MVAPSSSFSPSSSPSSSSPFFSGAEEGEADPGGVVAELPAVAADEVDEGLGFEDDDEDDDDDEEEVGVVLGEAVVRSPFFVGVVVAAGGLEDDDEPEEGEEEEEEEVVAAVVAAEATSGLFRPSSLTGLPRSAEGSGEGEDWGGYG